MQPYKLKLQIPYIARCLGVKEEELPLIESVSERQTRILAFCFRKTRKITVRTDTSLIVEVSQVLTNPREVRLDLKRNRKRYKRVNISDIGRSCFIPIDASYLMKLIHHLAEGGEKNFGPIVWLSDPATSRLIYRQEHSFNLNMAEFVFALNAYKILA